jgi:hypothetical protein
MLLARLGAGDRTKLGRIIELLPANGLISLSTVFKANYPESSRDHALDNLRQFRSRIRETSEAMPIGLILNTDRKTRNGPEDRWCWFTALDNSTATPSAPASVALAEGGFYSVRLADHGWQVAQFRQGRFWLCGSDIGLEEVPERGRRLYPGPSGTPQPGRRRTSSMRV